MAKKGKSLFTIAAISAVAAGAYYLYKKNSKEIAVDMDDEEDIENFSEEDDIDDKPIKRPYVSLDFNTVEQKVKDAANKVADVAETAAVSLGDIIKKGEERVEEFFDDRKAQDATEVVGVDDLNDDLEEAFEDASEKVEETFEKAEEKAEDAFEEVKEKVEDAVDTAAETVSEVFFSDTNE